MISLNGKNYPIAWTRGSMFRADLLGLPERLATGKTGYSTLCQMIWVMLDKKGRLAFPDAEDIAEVLPVEKAIENWAIVLKAYNAGEGVEDSEAKKPTGDSGAGQQSS